jgi:ankyrin repeat protein
MPLLWAAANAHETVMKLLFDKGADLNSKNNDGRTLLLWTAENGHEAVIRFLMKRDDVNTNLKDKHDRTPLSLAVCYSPGRTRAVSA